MERIDDAVARVLRLKYRLGLFDNPYWDIKKYDKFGSKEFAAVALQAAEESEVLLKNDGNILPIAKGKKILLTGPNANSMRCLNGGWSYSWQGHVADELAVEAVLDLTSRDLRALHAARHGRGVDTDGHRDGRVVDRDEWEGTRVLEVNERLADHDVFDAGDGDDVAGMGLLGRLAVQTLGDEELGDAGRGQ